MRRGHDRKKAMISFRLTVNVLLTLLYRAANHTIVGYDGVYSEWEIAIRLCLGRCNDLLSFALSNHSSRRHKGKSSICIYLVSSDAQDIASLSSCPNQD